jgi:hypothetical protein
MDRSNIFGVVAVIRNDEESASRELQPDPAAVIPPQYKGLVSDRDLEDVRRTVKEWAQPIRDRLKARLGLSLGVGRAGVGLSINAVVPEPFARLVEILGSPLLMFKMRRGALIDGININRGIREFLNYFPEVAEHARLTDSDSETLGAYAPLLERLMRIADEIRFRDEFAKINEDVLGSYRPSTGAIEVYWIPLAIFSRSASLPIEELTKVVLIHEYAHAHTHAGLDLDRKRWDTRKFVEAEREATEGLAQFYTALLTRDLRNNSFRDGDVDAHVTYERLLKHQSALYHTHLGWLHEEQKVIAEAVRFSVLEVRRAKTRCTHDMLSQHIEENLVRLRTDA